MKYKILLILAFFSLESFSQDSKMSIEVNYPLTFGKNYISENYKSVVDVGVKYIFSTIKTIDIGASINAGLFKYNYILFDDYGLSQDVKVSTYSIQPRIFSQLNIESIEKLKPTFALGYSLLLSKASHNLNNVKDNETQGGLNINLGISYNIKDNFFVQTQYDFIKLSSNNVPNIKYNTNINILKFGIGYRL